MKINVYVFRKVHRQHTFTVNGNPPNLQVNNKESSEFGQFYPMIKLSKIVEDDHNPESYGNDLTINPDQVRLIVINNLIDRYNSTN